MTFNQQYFDATLRHQIDLLRYGAGISRKVNAVLDETRADLKKQVERRLGKSTGFDAAGLIRLRELERAIDQTRSGAWNDVNEQWKRTAVDVALEEPLFVAGTLTNVLPVELDLVMPSDGTLRALATTRPFQGKNLKEWADSARRADLSRIHQQIRIGMVQGESARNIANRVFGARGAMSITANQADAVTRTVINHVSNAAQQEFLRENSDLFDVEQLVATLDARTTPVCRAQDGKQYPVGEGPVPPLHVACRSIRVGVIDGRAVGERPFKAGTEEQMLREYAEANGLGAVRSRDDLPRGTKKDFDAFSRRRMRELTGQVPAHTTYQQWLSGQSAAFQDDVLGPTKAKLFREGGLTLDKFVNRQGDELTLDEIRERNQEAWQKAGLGAAPSGPSDAERRRRLDAERREAEQRLAEAEKARRDAEAEAERQRIRAEKAEERRRKAEEAQAAEIERLRQVFDQAERDRAVAAEARRKRESAVDGKLLKHAAAVGSVGDVEPKYKQIAANVINKLRPKGVPELSNIEFHGAKNIRIEAFGTTINADGYYRPSERSLHLATNLPVLKQPLADTIYSTGDVSVSSEEAFGRLVAHEYGHHIHLSASAESGVNRVVFDAYRRAAPEAWQNSVLGAQPTPSTLPEGAPSRYGTANHNEFWAESFTSYQFDRAWLKQNKTVAFEMVSRVLELLDK